MISSNALKPFTFKFVEAGASVELEIRNETDQALKTVEILTIFLKDEETPGGGPSQAHIKFDTLKSIQPGETMVLPHHTWINGKPVGNDADLMARLKLIAGEPKPYVLDISWTDLEGKTRFQRIPVGH